MLLPLLFACSADPVALDSTPPADGGETPDTPEASAECPAAAGMMDGRTWTYTGDDYAQKLGTSIEATRTLSELGDGEYALEESLLETFPDGKTLAEETTYTWRCADGALLYEGFSSEGTSSYSASYTYGWSFEPALTLLPADAAEGAAWQDESEASYWYNDPDAVAHYGTWESTNAIEGTETVGDAWESLVTESIYVLDDGNYAIEGDDLRSWADDVGMTADGHAFLVLTAVVDP